MIAKISSGKSTAGLIRYLYGPGRANEHTDPHLVASWDGFAPDPGRTDDIAATKKLLVADLDLRVQQARRLGRAPKQHVWHCSIRTAPGDRLLDDATWGDIARRVVAATGIALTDDPDGCRWVAVRHAPDHIHIAATKVRGDLRTARHWNDYLTADRELAAVEEEYGLHRVVRGDRTAAKRPTRAEQEKAHRAGRDETARVRLRTLVRTAAAAATNAKEFLGLLTHTNGVLVEVLHFPSGELRGYKVALENDTNADGEPVWFSGSTLSPDLSLPKIQGRLAAADVPAGNSEGRLRPHPWHQATAATERIPRHLGQPDDGAAQAHLAAFGEALDAVALTAPPNVHAELRAAASAFERATRSRIRAEHHHARALRGAVKAMLHEPTPKDGALLAMFLDAALLVVIAAARWHDQRHHDQQTAAAHQTLLHLHAACEEAAAEPLAVLAQRRPPRQSVERYVRCVHQCVPEYAKQVVDDPAFDALTAALAEAEASGHAPEQLLRQAANQRALNDARSPARALVWRTQRLSARPAPSARAHTAMARSSAQRSNVSAHATAAVPAPQSPRTLRR
ncbi:relaxase/mobilization nuclease domain-containing protein [Streptomyces sp. NBC_00053]|uniref:relaxase/mobilization nuclease domain-containing protein n=1 Tax=unclassified Streptomyces TaxID=2593676 RepID=UPI00225B54E7|nr:MULTISPECIES: mobilization protein [unclassified Streptomyces]MCX5501094.1 relaxase/mobilization nuclease domain-containing protein [Streptomyces sp. NBC_00052]MCX5550371.1 relaxase/mobilization nuclease domain-containing protein [Streptomyces sp. NBC_00051]WSP48475.1 relaxase/mobilization nuclease domain-containing protein [Streptomyces sp. NBC_01243]